MLEALQNALELSAEISDYVAKGLANYGGVEVYQVVAAAAMAGENARAQAVADGYIFDFACVAESIAIQIQMDHANETYHKDAGYWEPRWLELLRD